MAELVLRTFITALSSLVQSWSTTGQRMLKTLVTLYLLVQLSTPQRMPMGDGELLEHQRNHTEVIHDTRLLPDGMEVTVHVLRDITIRYFFVIEEDNTPFAVTISPCLASLEWTVSLHALPEEGSGEGDSDHFAHQRQRPSSPAVGQMGKELIRHKGQDVYTFNYPDSPAGVFMLQVKSPERDTSFRIYGTTTPDSDRPYPELPSDPRLDVIRASRNKVLLAWKASPTEFRHLQPIKYCISANTQKNWKTMCGVQAMVEGYKAPRRSRFSGFGFRHEKGRKNRKMQKRKDKETVKKHDYRFVCLATKTHHSFLDLEPGRTYYFDVFAVNEVNGRSVAYYGAAVKTPEEKSDPNKVINLKDGRLIQSSVRKSSSPKTFIFEVARDSPKAVFSVQTCSKRVSVRVLKGNQVVKTTEVSNIEMIPVVNATAGEYRVEVQSSRRRPIQVRAFATTRPAKNPYPVLPDDTSIMAYANLVACDEVTISWLPVEEKAHYCVYKREIKKEEVLKLARSRSSCHGPEARKKKEKVVCKHHPGRGGVSRAITETIRKLKPDTNYLLDVYVSSFGKQSLTYQSKIVTTKGQCDSST